MRIQDPKRAERLADAEALRTAETTLACVLIALAVIALAGGLS